LKFNLERTRSVDRIRWINHAGFELQTQGLRIVCDPWLDGLAFAQSWALLSETQFKPADFAGVDYIWFSHEHPDHFSPANIRSIPESARSGITVLFQKTKDGG
jgi:UDP-MurNAc hydroxylase